MAHGVSHRKQVATAPVQMAASARTSFGNAGFRRQKSAIPMEVTFLLFDLRRSKIISAPAPTTSLLRFKPSSSPTLSLHSLSVRVSGYPDAIIQTRKSYGP